MEKILFISGLIPDDNEITNNSINFMNNAANAFQKQFIKGLKENGYDPVIVSAPFIGPFPTGYKKLFYKSKKYDDNVNYVSFFNLWGARNFSRYLNIKREIKKQKLYKIKKVIVYSVHTPFAKVAKYLKKKFPDVQICLITPDLPEFMNLRKHKSLAYKIFKKLDCSSFYSKIKYFDSFSLVSKHQSQKVNLFGKKETVIEGIAENVAKSYNPANNEIKKIVYTGSLNEQFGILNLISAVTSSNINAELVLLGNGDAVETIKDIAQKDKRIVFLGQVSLEEARNWQKKADVLVNPRLNEGDYTKYSFPSKTMEYLSTGKPVVCYKLDGIPDEYDEYLIYPKDDSIETLTKTLNIAVSLTEEESKIIFDKNTSFLLNNKNTAVSAKKIIDMFI